MRRSLEQASKRLHSENYTETYTKDTQNELKILEVIEAIECFLTCFESESLLRL